MNKNEKSAVAAASCTEKCASIMSKGTSRTPPIPTAPMNTPTTTEPDNNNSIETDTAFPWSANQSPV